ncbi:MAG TPA: DNA helicase, partial [Gammaproteobacteria bacterium]|nr:DNA helicase [Gammaproteobacteria bacterium]
MKQNSDATASSIKLAGFDQEILSSLAGMVIDDHRNSLPDLSNVAILLPGLECAPRLRRLLLDVARQEGSPALLGPRIQTLHGWLARHFATSTPLHPRRRELLLTEVLLEHPRLYGKGQPWTLTRELARLFDELTLYRVELPEQYDRFHRLVVDGYQTAPEAVPDALSREARLVHTLWRAWRDLLEAEGLVEPTTAYLKQLAECAGRPPPEARVYLAGFYHISPAEAAWLKAMLQTSRAILLLQGNPAPAVERGEQPDTVATRIQRLTGVPLERTGSSGESPLGRYLDSVYQTEGAYLRERAQGFANRHPRDPLEGRLLLFKAHGRDREARAVELQVRRWLLEGCEQIGIVTDNRRLARQVRSLLEQGGVAVEDSAGWALSTTSAAASLERWLQAVEQDFDQQPLLDLLKSPFLLADQPREERLSTVYRLERDIVRNGNIARGLPRYRQQLRFRQRSLPHWTGEAAREVEALLDRLEEAAAPLLPLLQGRHPPRKMVGALERSMELLGMEQAMDGDAAGRCILAELEQLGLAATDSGLLMSWREFRSWLGSTLEQ